MFYQLVRGYTGKNLQNRKEKLRLKNVKTYVKFREGTFLKSIFSFCWAVSGLPKTTRSEQGSFELFGALCNSVCISLIGRQFWGWTKNLSLRTSYRNPCSARALSSWYIIMVIKSILVGGIELNWLLGSFLQKNLSFFYDQEIKDSRLFLSGGLWSFKLRIQN